MFVAFTSALLTLSILQTNTDTFANGADPDEMADLFVLRFYGPVNPMGSCPARSIYLSG